MIQSVLIRCCMGLFRRISPLRDLDPIIRGRIATAFDNFKILPAAILLSLACSSAACANPGVGANLGLRANIRGDAHFGVFAVPERLRPRVDFWKDIFTKYGSSHSVIHHRDFPQITFGVIDLSQERQVMSATAFDAYKAQVVKRTVDSVQQQLLELADGGAARTPFQERALAHIVDRGLPRQELRSWVEKDLIRTQTGIRERYAEAIKRSWRYLPVMEQIFVQEYGLPKELTRLPFVESSFNYTAYSSVGAAGIWQFMPRTARSHRMLVGRYVDERRDPIKSTKAAAEYLRSAYSSLGSWPLAITSYNHGVGAVRSKVRKAGTNDLAAIIEDQHERYFGFASTNFFPEFLAALEIFDEHAKYFPEVEEDQPLRVVSYPIQRAVAASTVASRLGISVDQLKEANYALLDPVWSGRAPIPSGYTLRVPVGLKENADRTFGAGAVGLPLRVSEPAPKSAKSARANVASATYVTVKKGDTLATIAQKRGVSIERLKLANSLRSNSIVAGQKLRIP